MTDQSDQSRFDAAIRALEATEGAMVGVDDPALWLEVSRVGGALYYELDGDDDPSAAFEPWGDEPTIQAGSPTARAVASLTEAGGLLREISDPKLRAMGLGRLVMVNGFTVCRGDLEMPLW